MAVDAAPRSVRLAGALVGLQGLAGLVFAGALVYRGLHGSDLPRAVYGEAGYFTVLCAGVLAAAVGLLRGRRWARTPAIVVQLLLLGVAYFAFTGSDQRLLAGLLAAFCLAVLVLLFTGPARAWVTRVGDDPPEA